MSDVMMCPSCCGSCTPGNCMACAGSSSTFAAGKYVCFEDGAGPLSPYLAFNYNQMIHIEVAGVKSGYCLDCTQFNTVGACLPIVNSGCVASALGTFCTSSSLGFDCDGTGSNQVNPNPCDDCSNDTAGVTPPIDGLPCSVSPALCYYVYPQSCIGVSLNWACVDGVWEFDFGFTTTTGSIGTDSTTGIPFACDVIGDATFTSSTGTVACTNQPLVFNYQYADILSPTDCSDACDATLTSCQTGCGSDTACLAACTTAWQNCYTACCPLACDFSDATFTFTQEVCATIYPICACTASFPDGFAPCNTACVSACVSTEADCEAACNAGTYGSGGACITACNNADTFCLANCQSSGDPTCNSNCADSYSTCSNNCDIVNDACQAACAGDPGCIATCAAADFYCRQGCDTVQAGCQSACDPNSPVGYETCLNVTLSLDEACADKCSGDQQTCYAACYAAGGAVGSCTAACDAVAATCNANCGTANDVLVHACNCNLCFCNNNCAVAFTACQAACTVNLNLCIAGCQGDYLACVSPCDTTTMMAEGKVAGPVLPGKVIVRMAGEKGAGKATAGRRAAAPTFGPGAEMKAMLKEEFGVTKQCCACTNMMNQMNRWGANGCKLHHGEIVAVMRVNDAQIKAQQTKLEKAATVVKAAATVAWNAFTLQSGLAFKVNWTDPIPGLVDEAIRRAEAKEAAAIAKETTQP